VICSVGFALIAAQSLVLGLNRGFCEFVPLVGFDVQFWPGAGCCIQVSAWPSSCCCSGRVRIVEDYVIYRASSALEFTCTRWRDSGNLAGAECRIAESSWPFGDRRAHGQLSSLARTSRRETIAEVWNGQSLNLKSNQKRVVHPTATIPRRDGAHVRTCCRRTEAAERRVMRVFRVQALAWFKNGNLNLTLNSGRSTSLFHQFNESFEVMRRIMWPGGPQGDTALK